MNINNIPEELRMLPNWVCWHDNKIPKNPHTGNNAKCNDPSTWGTIDQALIGREKYGFSGIGFMFNKEDGLFGVDLDKCINKSAFVDEFVNTLQSYAEISISGKGLHIICKGILPDGPRRKSGVEMYSESRYFICTGNIYKPEYLDIKDCTESVKLLYQKYLCSEPKQSNDKYGYYNSLDDEALIKLALNSRDGTIFGMLYEGYWDNLYHSHSEADLAFCSRLAYWTGDDKLQMDRIFRASGLYREKWDEIHNAKHETYGEMTINKAIS